MPPGAACGTTKSRTAEIQGKLRSARAKRLRILKLAEGTFGPNSPELGDFASKGEK